MILQKIQKNLFFFLFAFFCYHCHPKVTSNTNTNTPLLYDKKTDSVATTVVKSDTIIWFSMKRGTCFGTCPVFEVRLCSNDMAYYKGIAFVSKKGNFEAKISKEWQEKLRNLIVKAKFNDFASFYPTEGKEMTDLPRCTLAFDGKEVVDNYESPNTLRQLQKDVEKMLESLEWQKK